MDRSFTFGGRSGQIFQLGVLVPNVQQAIRFLTDVMGLGPFTVMENFVAPAGSYRGGTDNPTLTIAHVCAGNFFLELIEQKTDTPSVYTEHRARHGWGLHHFGLAIAPEEYDARLEALFARGFEVVFSDQLPTGARVRYLAPREEERHRAMVEQCGAGYLECVEMIPAEEAFFAEMRRKADAGRAKPAGGAN